jgi:hypothetical protein
VKELRNVQVAKHIKDGSPNRGAMLLKVGVHAGLPVFYAERREEPLRLAEAFSPASRPVRDATA